MRRYTSEVRRTIGLLSSMVRGDESHSDQGEKSLLDTLDALDKIEKRNEDILELLGYAKKNLIKCGYAKDSMIIKEIDIKLK